MLARFPKSLCINYVKMGVKSDTLNNHTLTCIPILLLDEKYMFLLLSGWLTTTGSLKWRELHIAASISGGAEAVNAMKGALVNALSPPSLENDTRKSLPLTKDRVAVILNKFCVREGMA